MKQKMKRKPSHFILLLIIMLTVCACLKNAAPPQPDAGSTPALSSVGPVVKVVPEAKSVKVGTVTQVAIVIDQVNDLYAADVNLTFDPATLELIDADTTQTSLQITPGDFISPDFVAQNQGDNTHGTVHFAVTQIAPREPARGNGTLATMKFKTKVAGEITLTLEQALLASPEGEPISAQYRNGTITVSP